jgi:hypothetical protein
MRGPSQQCFVITPGRLAIKLSKPVDNERCDVKAVWGNAARELFGEGERGLYRIIYFKLFVKHFISSLEYV